MKPQLRDVALHYSRMQIETASSQKQVAMLHEKCVWCIVKARMIEGFERRFFLDRAQNILSQLQSALRIEDTVSEGLFFIYDYAYVLLDRGDDEDCRKSTEVLKLISDAFQELLRRL